MASGKRASMREGPLAALFRRTEEEGTESGGEGRPDAAEGEESRERAPEASTQRPPEPATAAAREREGEGEATEEPAPQRTGVPSPRERLRHAFSADIPENVLDPAAAEAPAAAAAPEPPDAYARPGAELYGQPASVGAPVFAWSASAAPASTPSTAWSTRRSRASSSSASTRTCSRCSSARRT